MGKIVAFHTTDAIYTREAARMLRSAERLRLDASATPIGIGTSWVRNASFKPTFLCKEREERRGPLLYVDVDAVFHRNPWPYMLSLDCDLAIFYSKKGILISATIFLRDTEATACLLREWQLRCDASPDEWDQVVLQRILDEDEASGQPKYVVHKLPSSFCWIFDKIDWAEPDEIFIEQLQASRSSMVFSGDAKDDRRHRRRLKRVARIEKELMRQR